MSNIKPSKSPNVSTVYDKRRRKPTTHKDWKKHREEKKSSYNITFQLYHWSHCITTSLNLCYIISHIVSLALNVQLGRNQNNIITPTHQALYYHLRHLRHQNNFHNKSYIKGAPSVVLSSTTTPPPPKQILPQECCSPRCSWLK